MSIRTRSSSGAISCFRVQSGCLAHLRRGEQEPVIDLETLHAKIGELTLENDAPPGLRGHTEGHGSS